VDEPIVEVIGCRLKKLGIGPSSNAWIWQFLAYWRGGWVKHEGAREWGAEDISHSKGEINPSRL